MIVSAGKILATAKVKTDGQSIVGDGLYTPLSISNEYKVDVSSYNIVSATDNVHIDKKEYVDRKLVEYSIGVDGTEYTGINPVLVDADEHSISLSEELVSSAIAGSKALGAIEANKDIWEKDTVYTAGENIFIDSNNVISGRDWSPEIETKADVSSLKPIKDSLDELSKSIDKTNEELGNLGKTVDSIDGYIKENEENWINSAYSVVSETPELLSVSTQEDAEHRSITFKLSASQDTKLTAGDWIDADKLANGEIAVSGYKTLYTEAPLYFSASDEYPDRVWLLYDKSNDPVLKKPAFAIANGWAGAENSYYSNGQGIDIVVPSKGIDSVYKFHMAREMVVQININAKFIAKSEALDSIGTVGFAAATVSGKQLTNNIEYSMLGALGQQYYCASTVARIDANDFGEAFPAEGIDIQFSFIADSDFVSEIAYPCISLYEIVNEVRV